jgi:hypothetical protein
VEVTLLYLEYCFEPVGLVKLENKVLTLLNGESMIFVAYLLTLILVPSLAAVGYLFTFPLIMMGGRNSPRLVSILQGITTGIVAGWGCQKIFSMCGVEFSNTPLWIMGFLFLLNDWQRLGRANSNLPPIGSAEMEDLSMDNSKLDNSSRSSLIEIGNMVGTPIGLLIWVNWIR